MDKRRILFIGEHPDAMTGNGNMMQAILKQVNYEKYNVSIFVAGFPVMQYTDCFKPQKYNLINAYKNNDIWGNHHLLSVLKTQNADLVVFIGIDIWRYAYEYESIRQLKQEKNFKLASIMPYDLPTLRKDWARWFSLFDFPCVYSQFGYELLKDKVNNLSYFRPPLLNHEIYTPLAEESVKAFKEQYFKGYDASTFIYGFIGANQVRKEPHKALKAFVNIRDKFTNQLYFYLHSELKGAFNLKQMCSDYGFRDNELVVKSPNIKMCQNDMTFLYNCIDCLVLPSMHEGLSWTVIEAMLCGVPVIASESTAHIELLENIGELVPCTENPLLPVITEDGEGLVESIGCSVADIEKSMMKIALDIDYRYELKYKGRKKAEQWLKGISDINNLIETSLLTPSASIRKEIIDKKKDAVLFAQHSAAGDVLMTTRCFKGLKERHPDIPFVYMTSKQYMGVVEGNKYLDEVIPWDKEELSKYKYVYNPHGERILKGHWGRNSNTILSDFYWKILMVEPCDFGVNIEQPEIDLVMKLMEREVCVVHTTGGDPKYRTYKYMSDVCESIKDDYLTVQVGGKNDYDAGAVLDLRGKLSYAETTWVIQEAKVAVTVDSFVSHLTGALGINQICLFGSGNYSVVKPNQIKGELICMVPDYVKYCKGLGPCSASVRECPLTCTGLHDPKEIVKHIHNLGVEL